MYEQLQKKIPYHRNEIFYLSIKIEVFVLCKHKPFMCYNFTNQKLNYLKLIVTVLSLFVSLLKLRSIITNMGKEI